MQISKSMKRYLVIGGIFCLGAILFWLLYHFQVIKHLNLTLAVVYVAYFVGLALVYNAAYCHKQQHRASTYWNALFATVAIAVSTALLIYGLVEGIILI